MVILWRYSEFFGIESLPCRFSQWLHHPQRLQRSQALRGVPGPMHSLQRRPAPTDLDTFYNINLTLELASFTVKQAMIDAYKLGDICRFGFSLSVKKNLCLNDRAAVIWMTEYSNWTVNVLIRLQAHKSKGKSMSWEVKSSVTFLDICSFRHMKIHRNDSLKLWMLLLTKVTALLLFQDMDLLLLLRACNRNRNCPVRVFSLGPTCLVYEQMLLH